MQLLFLWIDNQHTLKNINLNFGGPFRFEVEKEHTNTISVNIRKDSQYIEDLFPSSINNITAIVGKNGTGKTILINFITKLLTNQLNKNDKFLSAFYSNGHITIFHNLQPRKADEDLVVFLDEEELDEIENANWKIRRKGLARDRNIATFKPLYYIENEIDQIHPSNTIVGLERTTTIYYSPIIDFQYITNRNNNISDAYLADISTNNLIEDDFKNNSWLNIDKLETHRIKNIERQVAYIQSNTHGHPSDVKVPTYISLTFIRNELTARAIKNLSTDAKELYIFFKDILEIRHKTLNNSRNSKNNLFEIREAWMYLCFIDNFFTNLSLVDDDTIDLLQIDYEKWTNSPFVKSAISRNNFFKLILYFIEEQKWISSYWPSKLFTYLNNIIFEEKEYSQGTDNETTITSVNLYIIEFYKEYLQKFDNIESVGFIKFNWSNMSTGEKLQLDLYSRLYYTFKSLPEYNQDNIFIIIDEGELGLHPFWQKSYINNTILYLVKLIENLKIDTEIQIILTSHSPFILSDLPTNNLILLKHDTLKNHTTNIESLEVSQQTFAANIHTLLSDSFFLEDGLIGNFSMDKVHNIINIINDSEKISNTDFIKIDKLIQIIAEPILREKLTEMLIAKAPNEERRRLIQKQIQQLLSELNNDNENQPL